MDDIVPYIPPLASYRVNLEVGPSRLGVPIIHPEDLREEALGPNATDSIKARLKAACRCEQIALFLCTTEGDQGQSGEAINERGELVGWWLFPDGRLDIRPYRIDEVDPAVLAHPEYLAAQEEIGEWLAAKWISTEPLTEAELAQAVRFAERHGWLDATIFP